MTVTRDFSYLNNLRPSDACFGEVVGITLDISEGYDILNLGFSKRKSIHVPPSTNAYWNWMALQADLTRYHGEMGVSRRDRSMQNSLLNAAIHWIHLYEVESAYGDGTLGSKQYYNVLVHQSYDGHCYCEISLPRESFKVVKTISLVDPSI